ncbi:hypothetical protein CVT26_000621 [Gymnopilus dilepis]|uniref:Uncharacterized protein n=1 Tax=Gymnopilus dilepis TaxID=231916 RepID=A0A409Y2A1_9AGAR|nr:hypothetical protein CVT26_000621 [Gymnopilus dilepis]
MSLLLLRPSPATRWSGAHPIIYHLYPFIPKTNGQDDRVLVVVGRSDRCDKGDGFGISCGWRGEGVLGLKSSEAVMATGSRVLCGCGSVDVVWCCFAIAAVDRTRRLLCLGAAAFITAANPGGGRAHDIGLLTIYASTDLILTSDFIPSNSAGDQGSFLEAGFRVVEVDLKRRGT